MLIEGKNEGESLALLIWALEMSLMALQYTLLPLPNANPEKGRRGRRNGTNLIHQCGNRQNKGVEREREELRERREIGERVRDVGRRK